MNVETLVGNQSPQKPVIQCKECGDTPKNVFSRAWQEKYKKVELRILTINLIVN